MAFYNRTEVGLKKTGESVTVPNNPRAKLMYYLDCVCTVLKFDDDDVSRFRRYRNYYTLRDSDTTALIGLCLLLKPDILLNKCIFQDDEMCGDRSNEFYEIEAVNKHLLVTESILVGGQRKRVTKIMTFKMGWIKNNWSDPLKTLVEQKQADAEREARQQAEREARQRAEREARQQAEREARQRAERRRRSNDSSCVIQ